MGVWSTAVRRVTSVNTPFADGTGWVEAPASAARLAACEFGTALTVIGPCGCCVVVGGGWIDFASRR